MIKNWYVGHSGWIIPLKNKYLTLFFSCSLSIFPLALLLDHALVRIVKRAVNHHHSEWFATLLPHPRSFPSGHTTRVARCARFLHARLLSDCLMRFVVLFWTVLLALMQVLLGQHNVSGVVLALAMGSCHYSVVETCWLSVEGLQDAVIAALRKHVTQRGWETHRHYYIDKQFIKGIFTFNYTQSMAYTQAQACNKEDLSQIHTQPLKCKLILMSYS